MKPALLEHRGNLPVTGLGARVMAGEVIAMRGCMDRIGLMAGLRAASLQGIEEFGGAELARRVEDAGFEQIHRWVGAEELPELTERIYRIVTGRAANWLNRLVPVVFGSRRPFYFEREPNVRFLLPWALTRPHQAAYGRFARRHGEGKITAHGPHRDSWLDCPDNAINVWIAMGPVRRGNGMSFFLDRYGSEVGHLASGAIAPDEHPGAPTNFELAPGDALVFHGDQLHASELNRTGETRHVISFRLTLDKPHFPNGHYHHYLHSSLAAGRAAPLAGIPANLAWSYVTTRIGWIQNRLAPGSGRRVPPETQNAPAGRTGGGAGRRINVSDLGAGELRAVSDRLCLARTGDGRVVAFSRHCPHQGADLSLGTVQNGNLVCPWHNVPFGLHDGHSDCDGLRDLRLVTLDEADGVVALPE